MSQVDETKRQTILTEVVQKLIAEGANPNDLKEELEEAIEDTQEWGLWGDGTWRKETVCSKCGSVYVGICSDEGTDPDIVDFDNLAFHKNQKGVTVIPLKEWLKLHPEKDSK